MSTLLRVTCNRFHAGRPISQHQNHVHNPQSLSCRAAYQSTSMFLLVTHNPFHAGQPINQLEAEYKKQAGLIAKLQGSTMANSRAHNQLVQHFQELMAQVQLNTKSQELLQKLSGMGANPTGIHLTFGMRCCLLHVRQSLCNLFCVLVTFFMH